MAKCKHGLTVGTCSLCLGYKQSRPTTARGDLVATMIITDLANQGIARRENGRFKTEPAHFKHREKYERREVVAGDIELTPKAKCEVG